MNFVIYVLVLTRSLAMILTGPIWPSFAYFLYLILISVPAFLGWRARGRSRTALLISRLFFLNTSLSGTLRPQVLPMAAHDVSRARAARILLLVLLLLQECGCGSFASQSSVRIASVHVLHSVRPLVRRSSLGARIKFVFWSKAQNSKSFSCSSKRPKCASLASLRRLAHARSRPARSLNPKTGFCRIFFGPPF